MNNINKITFIFFISIVSFYNFSHATSELFQCKENAKVVIQDYPCHTSRSQYLFELNNLKSLDSRAISPTQNFEAGSIMTSPLAIDNLNSRPDNSIEDIQKNAQREMELVKLQDMLEQIAIEEEAEEERIQYAEEIEEQHLNAEKKRAQVEEYNRALQHDIQISNVKSRNMNYFIMQSILIFSLVFFIIKSINKKKIGGMHLNENAGILSKKGNKMSENQKYGVSVMVVSFLLVIAIFIFSDGWRSDLDLISNILKNYEFRFIPITYFTGEVPYAQMHTPIDIYSKHLLLFFTVIFAYGFTTFYEITPSFRPWKGMWEKLRKIFFY